MTDLIVELSKYLMTLLFAFYTYECFSSFRGKLTPEKRAKIFKRQMCLMYLIHLDAFLAIYAVTDDIRMILFYVVQAAFIAVTISSYRLVYGRASGLLINNMCMLLMIGFIMITRLSFDKAIRQFAIAVGAMVCSLIIPVLIQKVRFLRKMPWLYAAAGIIGLLAVLAFGITSSGAKISISIAGISVQPSEFVKIIFVFFVACMLYENTDLKHVCIATVLAAVHVLILVLSRDLGGALIFFVPRWWHISCFPTCACVSWHGRIRSQELRMRATRSASPCSPSVPAAGLEWDYTRGCRKRFRWSSRTLSFPPLRRRWAAFLQSVF